MPAANIAFELPPTGAMRSHLPMRPIDLVHLARQTMGDRELEIEILGLFARQARAALLDMTANPDSPSAPSPAAVAHRIKGAANAVGAFKVVAAAAEIEAGRCDAVALSHFGACVLEAEEFIAKLRG